MQIGDASPLGVGWVKRLRITSVIGAVAVATLVALAAFGSRSSDLSSAKVLPPVAPDPFSVTTEELVAWPPHDTVVVDLRPPDEFRRVRLAGSVNFSLRELKTKAYLKGSDLLLVDHGYHAGRTRDACQALRESGFKTVRYIAGGLSAFRGRDGVLTGERLAEAQLSRLPPRDFGESRSEAGWLVVDTADAPLLSVDEVGHPVIHVPFKNGSRFAARLETALARDRPNGAGSTTVIVDRDGASYAAIERDVEPLHADSLYFLAGGVEAYRAHRANQEAMLARAAQPPCSDCNR